jgi:hypothetical protein
VWRLVVEQVATLREIDTHYDLIDLLDAHEALDLKYEAEEQAVKEAERQHGS